MSKIFYFLLIVGAIWYFTKTDEGRSEVSTLRKEIGINLSPCEKLEKQIQDAFIGMSEAQAGMLNLGLMVRLQQDMKDNNITDTDKSCQNLLNQEVVSKIKERIIKSSFNGIPMMK